jgi:hypothetical protein
VDLRCTLEIDIALPSWYSCHMEAQTFAIKSLFVQNGIMSFSLGIVLILLFRSFMKKNVKHVVVFLVWVGIVLWFFNSSFFGFSEVTVSRKAIKLNYGILSFRDETLPLTTQWKIETSPSGILKTSKLYFIQIGEYRSMKVKGKTQLALIRKIGDTIDRLRKRQTG